MFCSMSIMTDLIVDYNAIDIVFIHISGAIFYKNTTWLQSKYRIIYDIK